MTGYAADGEHLHPTWEAAAAALTDSVQGWEIPDDGTGVLDTDAFIASIGGYMNALAAVLDDRAEYLGGGDTPVATSVGEQLVEFANSLRLMAGDADAVYEEWRNNDQNAHDLARAEGEVPRADLFNV